MNKLILLFFFLSSFLFAQTSVWKVQKNDDVVYIGGTIHLLRPSDYPLPKEFNSAYSLSNKIYFETDLSGINTQKAQQLMLKEMLLEKGKTLSSLLSKETYTLLEKTCTKYGINIKTLESFKPAMPVLMLTIAELQSLGISLDGVDMFFERKAVTDGKKLGKLETIEEQISFLSSFGSGNEDEFIIQSIEDLDKTKELYEKIIASWKIGQMKEINQYLIKDIKINYPELYTTLIVNRNNNWLPKIENMFNNRDKEFVLVGVGHLVGDDGVIEQLRKKGYKVEKF